MTKSKLKFFLLIGFLLIQIGPVLACRCLLPVNFTLGEVESYDYVAWVKVKGRKPSESKGEVRTYEERFHWAEIEELHRFKGNSTKELKIRGGHRDLGFVTSCDLGMEVGEEWVLFAKESNGEFMVGACSRSEKYRENDGFRDWGSERGIRMLSVLDSAFNQGKLDIMQISKDTLFFPNGKIERVKFPSDQDGIVELNYFTPLGNLIGVEHLKNGLRHGFYAWNYKDGTRLTQKNYKNGVQVGLSYFWTKEFPDKPHGESFYDDQGKWVFSREYTVGVYGRFLSQESIMDHEKKKLIYRIYDEFGMKMAEESQEID
uniref:hypothetical protein n=1 Tax=Algoriphagus sp. TaxID=1872435 RepID=UPI00258A806B|nr:hypothetical protein [Algoriphagus sp.]